MLGNRQLNSTESISVKLERAGIFLTRLFLPVVKMSVSFQRDIVIMFM